jgi:hypothetical protein
MRPVHISTAMTARTIRTKTAAGRHLQSRLVLVTILTARLAMLARADLKTAIVLGQHS